MSNSVNYTVYKDDVEGEMQAVPDEELCILKHCQRPEVSNLCREECYQLANVNK